MVDLSAPKDDKRGEPDNTIQLQAKDFPPSISIRWFMRWTFDELIEFTIQGCVSWMAFSSGAIDSAQSRLDLGFPFKTVIT